MKTILVTGGAGFIGGCYVRRHVRRGDCRIVNLDKLTYAGNLDSLPDPDGDRYVFVHGDIGDTDLVARLLDQYRPDAVMNFAAESHVDRSIDGPLAFVETNVVATVKLLQAVRGYWTQLEAPEQAEFRFHCCGCDSDKLVTIEKGDSSDA